MNGNCSSRCLIWTVNSWGKLLGEHHRINNKESQSRCDGDRHYHICFGDRGHTRMGAVGGGGVRVTPVLPFSECTCSACMAGVYLACVLEFLIDISFSSHCTFTTVPIPGVTGQE